MRFLFKHYLMRLASIVTSGVGLTDMENSDEAEADQASVRITCFQPQHIDGVCMIESSSFPNPFSRSFLMELSRKCPDTFLVAEKESQILGYVVAETYHGQAHILSIAVREDWRRRHLGSRLMYRLFEILKSKEVKDVVLEVRRSNIAARAFYESLGLKVAGNIRGYYEDGEDAEVYRLRLQDTSM